jgi:hypothetical protein
MKLTQKDILAEGFWDTIAAPLRVAGGVAGAAVKGGASLLRKVAPEITNPLDKLEAGARDVGDALRQGYDVGSGGLQKAYKDILLDAGYIMDMSKCVTKSGKNKVVIGSRIIGHSKSGKPYGDPKRKLSFIFNKDNQFKIINTSANDTSRLNVRRPTKYKTVKKKP